MKIKGVSINGVHSFYDLGLTLSGRVLNPPKPRTVQKKIPFRSGSYDFSTIAGERIYDDAIIEYEFSFAEFDLDEIERQKEKAIGWLLSANEKAEISDDALGEKYYIGTLTDMDWDEEFGEATLKARFTCEPYKYTKNITEIPKQSEQGSPRFTGEEIKIVNRGNIANKLSVSILANPGSTTFIFVDGSKKGEATSDEKDVVLPIPNALFETKIAPGEHTVSVKPKKSGSPAVFIAQLKERWI